MLGVFEEKVRETWSKKKSVVPEKTEGLKKTEERRKKEESLRILITKDLSAEAVAIEDPERKEKNPLNFLKNLLEHK